MKLQIGMKVLIKTDKGYLEDSGKEKTITADLPYFNKQRAFQLDNERGATWIIDDFEKCVNYPNLPME